MASCPVGNIKSTQPPAGYPRRGMNKEETEMGRLSDDDLEGVSGGVLFNASKISGSDPGKPWEVLDNNNGNVLNRFTNRADAEKWTRDTYGNAGGNTMEVNWDQVQAMRRR